MPISFSGGPHLKSPNLGHSFVNRQSVTSIIGAAAPVTASLVIGGMVLWMMIALPIGILSALRPRSLLDRFSMTGVLIGISAHPVWLGLIASYLIGYKLGWTPIAGYANFFHPLYAQPGGPVQWAYHLILPWITFAILFAAIYVRMIRANVLETMNEDYVRTARAKGAPESRVMRSHILRNALLPVVTMLGMDVGLALGGAVFTETVYSLERPRLPVDLEPEQLRQPDRARHPRVRHDRDHRAQPGRRPAVRLDRPADPARPSHPR